MKRKLPNTYASKGKPSRHYNSRMVEFKRGMVQEMRGFLGVGLMDEKLKKSIVNGSF